MTATPFTERVLDRLESAPRGRSQLPTCDVQGCLRTTQGGKPFCSSHFARLPRAAEVIKILEEREHEHAEAKKRRVKLDGLLAAELESFLAVHGTCSVRRAALDLDWSREVVHVIASALRKAGRLEYGLDVHQRGVLSAPDAQGSANSGPLLSWVG